MRIVDAVAGPVGVHYTDDRGFSSRRGAAASYILTSHRRHWLISQVIDCMASA